MHEPRPVRIVLDLDPSGETICGAVSDAFRDSHPFYGWLELAGALEAARIAAERATAAIAQRSSAGNSVSERW